MKIDFLQFGPKHLNPGFNAKFIRAYLDKADFEILVLPELANTAYLHDDKDALLAASEAAGGSGNAAFNWPLWTLSQKKRLTNA